MKDTIKAMIPKKHSNKMLMIEIAIGSTIAALPALTSEMTVQHAAMIGLVLAIFKGYLVSIKQS